MSFQTAGFDAGEVEGVVGVGAGTGERTGYVGVVVRGVMPDGGIVDAHIGVGEPHTARGQGRRVVAYGGGIDARQRVARHLYSGRLLHIDAGAGLGTVIADDTSADEGVGLEVQTSAVGRGFVVFDDAVAYMGEVRHDGSAADTVLGIRRVGITVYDEYAIDNGAVFLILHYCQLTAVVYLFLVISEQIVGESDHMIGMSGCSCCGHHIAGEDRAEGERLALGKVTREAALHLYAVRDDEGVVGDIIVIAEAYQVKHGRARRGIDLSAVLVRSGMDGVTLQPYFDRPGAVRITGYGRISGRAIACLGHEGVFVPSGGIEDELEFLQTGCVGGRRSRSITTRRSEGYIEYRLARVRRCIRTDSKRRVELIRTYINLAVLNTIGEIHIFVREHTFVIRRDISFIDTSGTVF